MKVDRNQLMEDGFIILRNVVPPDKLESVRAAVEHMVERRRETSQQQRLPGETHGAWAASAQPRLQFHADCDAESTAAIEPVEAVRCLADEQQLPGQGLELDGAGAAVAVQPVLDGRAFQGSDTGFDGSGVLGQRVQTPDQFVDLLREGRDIVLRRGCARLQQGQTRL